MVRILEMFGEPITYGGQESVVYNMLSTFDLKNDFEVDLFTPYFADNQYLRNLISDNDGNVYSLNKEFKTNDNRFLLSKDVNSFFDKNNNYDVVHIHTGSLTSMYVYAKAAKEHNIKKVIVHSHIASKKNGLVYKLFKTIICMLLQKYVDVYLGCSKEAITSKFTEEIVDKSKVVYNGIDVGKFRFNNEYREDIRNKYSIRDKFVIGSLGRLDKQKNNDFMIDIINSFAGYDNIILMIVGTGATENELKNMCIDLHLDKKVIFTGNQVETYKYYCAFDCFILPSIYEGMPVTAIEAQISGLPTLISDRVTTDVCISSECMFIGIDSSNIWVDEIKNFFKKSDTEYNRANDSIDYNKFDRNKTFKIVENIYNE